MEYFIFGYVILVKGVSRDPITVKSIEKAFPPTTTCAVRSFLGMAIYGAKFSSNFSDVSGLLWKLAKQDQLFCGVKSKKDLSI